MPYIDPEARRRLLDAGGQPQTAGELNYVITRAVDQFLQAQGHLRYDNLNTSVGVLECAKLELYRRLAAPYEDRKCDENGDVYGSQG